MKSYLKSTVSAFAALPTVAAFIVRDITIKKFNDFLVFKRFRAKCVATNFNCQMANRYSGVVTEFKLDFLP